MSRFLSARLLAGFLWFLALTLPEVARAEEWFSLKTGTVYENLPAQLLELVNVYGFHDENEFCAVGQRSTDGDIALIYWPTEDQLYYWNPKIPDQSSLLESQSLDLNKDVVATASEQGTSMVLVTESYVRGIIQNCAKYGDQYHIRKSDSGWKSPSGFEEFSSLKTQLQNLVLPPAWLLSADPGTIRASSKINKFCIIAQQDRSWLVAYVYWETERRLILWLPAPNDDYALVGTFGDVDLTKALAADGSPNDSVYEMPRKYVRDIIAACLKQGVKVTLHNNTIEQDK